MATTRECRRKHWRVWTTKTLDDDTEIVVCPICGGEPTADQIERSPRIKT
jgi:hypothetical protein